MIFNYSLFETTFYTLPHNSDGVLWYQVGCPCVRSICPSVWTSVVCLFVCPFIHIFVSDDNLSKCKWIFTKLGVCIDIIET